MGQGEKTMTTWGYVAGSFCIFLALLAFSSSIMSIVAIKGSVPINVRDNTVVIDVLAIIVSVGTAILGGITICKIYQANQLYLKTAVLAAEGKIPISSKPSNVQTPVYAQNPVYANTNPPRPAARPLAPPPHLSRPNSSPTRAEIPESIFM